MTIYEKILLFLGSSGSTLFLGRKLLYKFSPKNNSNNITKELVSLVNYWRQEAETSHKKYMKAVEDNTALKIERALINSKKESIPIAMWEKDLSGRLVWCSDEYERIFLNPFGKTKADVLAKTDVESWGEIGKSWNKNDLWCIENKCSWYGEEILINGAIDLLAAFHIYKNVIIYENKAVGTLGLAIEVRKK